MQNLIVIRSFGSYRIGDVVSDEQSIERILASEHSTHVVRVKSLQEG